MSLKDLLSQPGSTLRQWARSNKKTLAVGACWVLGIVFIIVSIVTLLKSLALA